MIAFKGASKDMTARLGNHDGEVFRIGKTYTVKESKTARCGYHCCENPVQCLGYYSLDTDRFFEVEASGDIVEDDRERIACTRMTILKELDLKDFFAECLKYIIAHPDRRPWEWNGGGVEIAKNKARAKKIAIARGMDPRAMVGEPNGHIGLIRQDANGWILAARAIRADGKVYAPNTWYHINENGIIEEVRNDEA